MAAAHEKHSHRILYFQVFGALAFLTLAEVGITFGPPSMKYVIVGALVGLALAKAAMVAAFYMHLRFEKTTLAVIAAVPLFLCVFLAFALYPDHSAVQHKTQNVPPPPAESEHH
jgi:cytochrome c oxidase subunit IV